MMKWFTPLETPDTERSDPKFLAGFTLIEVLIAALILTVVTTGLAYVFLAGRKHLLHTSSRIQAAELGRLFLGPLQMDVREDTWDESPVDPAPNNLLTVGEYKSLNNPNPVFSGYTVVTSLEKPENFEEPSIDNITYYPAYKVEDKEGLRKVKLTLTWNEPSS